MKVSKILVLSNSRGSDKVMLYTDLIEGTWPYLNECTFSTDVASGSGLEWTKKNFPKVEIEVIEI